MAIYAANGAKLFLGAALAAKSVDFVLEDFDDQVWGEVKELESLGQAGDTSAEITFDSIGEGRTKRLKGTRNAGSMDIVCGLDADDAGQTALVAAEKTAYDYAVKVVLNDAPSGGTPSTRYFIAKIASAVEVMDAANNVLKLNVSLWVNSNIVKVNRAAAVGG